MLNLSPKELIQNRLKCFSEDFNRKQEYFKQLCDEVEVSRKEIGDLMLSMLEYKEWLVKHND